MADIIFALAPGVDVAGKYIFLDNDFLGELFRDEELAEKAPRFFDKSFFFVDSLTEFEFFRGQYLPKELSWARAFVEQPLFLKTVSHQEVFARLQENAMQLSKVYSHAREAKGCSTPDLFLAARLCVTEGAFLVTGNSADFPECVFDLVGTISKRQANNGSVQSYCILSLNREKYAAALAKIALLQKA